MKREQALKIVRRFESYHEAFVNCGGGDPNDIELKHLEYKLEREKLLQALIKSVDIRIGAP